MSFETAGPIIGLLPALLAAVSTSFVVAFLLVRTQHLHGPLTNDGLSGLQKFHRVPTPRVGGLAIVAGCLAALPFLPGQYQTTWTLVLLAGVPALVAGLVEDLTKRVGVRNRLLATMASGVLFALLTGYTMHQVNLPGVDWLLSFGLVAILFTGFAMGGVANAVNIIDGFHGLAAGSLMIMFGGFAYVAYAVGDELVLGLALLSIAVILGFFVLNFPLGKIFLGDGGAYFAGYLLAALGVLLPTRNADVSAWTAILICAYPVVETLASMRRKARRTGHSVGQPDRVHFHMLAHRRYARRMVRNGRNGHLRNPATSVVTWLLPLVTAIAAAIAYDSVIACAALFFATVWLYGLLYRVMSLNSPQLPLGLARLL